MNTIIETALKNIQDENLFMTDYINLVESEKESLAERLNRMEAETAAFKAETAAKFSETAANLVEHTNRISFLENQNHYQQVVIDDQDKRISFLEVCIKNLTKEITRVTGLWDNSSKKLRDLSNRNNADRNTKIAETINAKVFNYYEH